MLSEIKMELNLENNISVNNTTKFKLSTTGKILIGITGGSALALTVICAPFVSPALRKICLPYVPATTIQVQNVMKALNKRNGTLIDLGSGDGRIVLAAKSNFKADGVELNPWLILYSKLDAFRQGQYKNTNFIRKDLWKVPMDNYDNIVIFGVKEMMNDLEKKFMKECTSDCNIIACRFPLPTLEPQRVIGEGIDTVWTYKINEQIKQPS